MKYFPSAAIQIELLKVGLEQFAQGVELDDQELSAKIKEFCAHPIHAGETEQELLDRAAYFLIWRDHGVPEVGKSAEDVTAKRITVMHESLREMVKEHFPKMAGDFADVKAAASIQANCAKMLNAQFGKFIDQHHLENLRLRGDFRALHNAIVSGQVEAITTAQGETDQIRKVIRSFGKMVFWGLLAIISILVALTFFTARAHAQIDVIQFQDSAGSIVKTFAAPFKIKCSTNLTCTASGSTLTMVSAAGGSGTPGGSDTQVQFNDATAFGGIAGMTYIKASTLVKMQAGTKFSLTDTVDLTKAAQFDLSGIATATTRTFILPNASGTFCLLSTCINTLSVTAPITSTGGQTPSIGMVNQGTTTTVLHGNASGNPTFGAVVQGDVTNGYVDLSSAQTVAGAKKYGNIDNTCFLDGTVNTTLAAAITCAGSTGTIEVAPSAGTITVPTNATIPVGVTLQVDQGGGLSIATGVTLTINGSVSAGPYVIFTYVGTGVVAMSATATPTVLCNWWAGSDIHVSCQNAVNAMDSGSAISGILQIAPGTYNNVVGTITIPIYNNGRFTLTKYGSVLNLGVGASGYAIDTKETNGAPNNSNLIIQGGVINCGGNSGWKGGIRLLPTNGITVRDESIISCNNASAGDGIAVEGSILVNIVNTQLLGNWNGLHAYGTKCLTSTPFTCSPTQVGTTLPYTPNGLHAIGNIFGNSARWGMYLDTATFGHANQILNPVLVANDFEANNGAAGAGGLDAEATVGLALTDNYFELNLAHNIQLGVAGVANNLGTSMVGNWFTANAGIPNEIELINASDVSIDGNTEGGAAPSTCFVNQTLTANKLYMGINSMFTSSPLCVAGSSATPTGLLGLNQNAGTFLNTFSGRGLVNNVDGFKIYFDSGPSKLSLEGTTSGGEVVDNPITQTIATWTNGGVWAFRNDVTPLAANQAHLGTNALPWLNVVIGNAATNNITLQGTATSAKAATLPDNTGTVAETNLNNNFSAEQTFAPTTSTVAPIQITAQLGAPSSAPTLTCSNTGGSLAAATHFFKIAFNNTTAGVTTVSAEASCATTGTTGSVVVTAPTLPTNATGYTVYDSNTTNTELTQAASGACVNISANCTVTTLAAGAAMPSANNASACPTAHTALFGEEYCLSSDGTTPNNIEAHTPAPGTAGAVLTYDSGGTNAITDTVNGTITSYTNNKPLVAKSGVQFGVNASNVITQNFSGDTAHSLSQTAKTAAVTTFTLCAATAGTACGQVGQYRISYNFWGSGTACSAVTAGSVGLNLTWTDENAVAHTTISMPMAWDQKSAAAGILFNFNTALGTEGASGSYIISTNGTIIQAATTYTACTTGTGTYNLRMTVEQLQ